MSKDCDSCFLAAVPATSWHVLVQPPLGVVDIALVLGFRAMMQMQAAAGLVIFVSKLTVESFQAYCAAHENATDGIQPLLSPFHIAAELSCNALPREASLPDLDISLDLAAISISVTDELRAIASFLALRRPSEVLPNETAGTLQVSNAPATLLGLLQ